MTAYSPPTNIFVSFPEENNKGSISIKFNKNFAAPNDAILHYFINGEHVAQTAAIVEDNIIHCQLPIGAYYLAICYEDSNTKEYGPKSEAVGFNVTPPAPNCYLSGEIGYTFFSVAWETVPNANGYNVYVNGLSYFTPYTSYIFTEQTPETTYSIFVTAVVDDIESKESNNLLIVTPKIPAPKTTKFSHITANSFTFTWAPIVGGSLYEVFRHASPASLEVVDCCSISYINVLSKTTETLAVRAKIGNFYSDWAWNSVTTPLAVPKLPDKLIVDNISDSSIVLRWEYCSPEPVLGYKIFKNTRLYAIVHNGITSYKVDNLLSGRMENWSVCAYNLDGDGPSLALAATTIPCSPVPVIQSDINSATVSWSAVCGATAYDIYLDDTPPIETIGTSHVFAHLSPDFHSVSVVAKNQSGHSIPSIKQKFETLLAPPAVTIESSQDIGESRLRFVWTEVPSATSYNIYLNGVFIKNQENGTERVLELEQLFANTVYVIEVESKNASKTSSKTRIIQHTKPLPPNNIRINWKNEKNIGLAWQSADNITEYICYTDGERIGASKTPYIMVPNTNSATAIQVSTIRTNNQSYISTLESKLSHIVSLQPSTSITAENTYQSPAIEVHSAAGIRTTSGQIFVTGGKQLKMGSNRSVNINHLNQFYLFNDLPQARFGHVMFGNDKEFYVHGGKTLNGHHCSTNLKYNVKDKTWTSISNLNIGLSSHAAGECLSVEDAPGYYIHGGLEGAAAIVSNKVYKFSPTTNAISLVSSISGPALANHSALLLNGYSEDEITYGRGLYLFGGMTGAGEPNKLFWRYDFVINAWQKLATSPDELSVHAKIVAIPSIPQSIFAYAGGEYIWEYNIKANQWEKRRVDSPFPEIRKDHLVFAGIAANCPCLFVCSGQNIAATRIYNDFWIVPAVFPPPQLSCSNISHNELSISWPQEPTAQQYKVYVNSEIPIVTSETSLTIANLSPNTTYQVRVASLFETYESQHSSSVLYAETLPLFGPKSVNAVAIKNTISIQWQSSAAATKYIIYWGLAATNTFTNSIEVDATTLNYTLANLPLQNYYRIGIGGKDASGTLLKITECQNIIWVGTPLIPNNLRVISVSYNAIELDWDISAGATTYKIKYGNKIIDTLGKTSYRITELAPRTSFCFYLCSVNSVESTSEYVSINCTTSDIPRVDIDIKDLDYNAFIVCWTPQPEAQSYSIFVNQALYQTVAKEQVSCQIKDRIPLSPYEITVDWTDGRYVSEQSSPLQVTTCSMPIIHDISASKYTFTTCQINWSTMCNATEYIVYLNKIKLTTTNTNSIVIENLLPEEVYDVQIAWTDGLHTSMPCHPYVIIMPKKIETPSIARVEANGHNFFNVVWYGVATALYYQILINGELYPTRFKSSPATNIPFPNVGRMAQISIIACNERGCSNPSSSFSAIPTPPPKAPSCLGMTTSRVQSFDVIKWEKVAGAAFYKLNLNGLDHAMEYENNYAASVPFSCSDQPTTLRIRACNDGGCSVLSEASLIISPAPPEQSPIIAEEYKSVPVPLPVSLKWNSLSGVSQYEVHVSQSLDFISNNLIKFVEVPSCVVSQGLEEGKRFYWRVRASNVSGCGPWSSTGSFIAGLSPLVIIYPEHRSKNVDLAPELNWRPKDLETASATVYELQLGDNLDRPLLTLSDLSTPSFQVPNEILSRQTKYYWRIRAKAIAVATDWSQPYEFTTTDAPSRPQLAAPTDLTQETPLPLIFSWEPSFGGSQITYHLQIAVDEQFASLICDQKELFVPTFSMKDMKDLMGGQRYYWRVRSFNRITYSNWSRCFSFVVACPPSNDLRPLTIFSDDAANRESIVLAWQKPNNTGVIKYELQIAKDIAFVDVILHRLNIMDTNSIVRKDEFDYTPFAYWRVRGTSEYGVGGWTIPCLLRINDCFPGADTTILQHKTPLETNASTAIGTEGVTQFSATPLYDGNALQLTWTNPNIEDFAGVLILRRSDTYPLSFDDSSAEIIYSGNGETMVDRGESID